MRRRALEGSGSLAMESRRTSYYSVLGVALCSSDEEIRRAYRRLAMQWHPDKWTRSPSSLCEAKQKFQQIQEAYSVLSDRGKRRQYDAGLNNTGEEEDDEVEGFNDFLQEMASLMRDARKEEKTYSNEELQSMFWDMARGFEIPEWGGTSTYETQRFGGPSSFFESTTMATSSFQESIIGGNEYIGLN